MPAKMLTLISFRILLLSMSVSPFFNSCQATHGRASGSRDLDMPGGQPNPSAAVTVPTQPTSAMNVVAKIDIGGDWMCVGAGSLWEPSGGKLARVDPVQHSVLTKVDGASGNFCHISPDQKTMWVADVYGGKLHKIDVDTNTVTGNFDVPITSGSEGSFAVTEGGVWVVTSIGGTSSGTLTRVDPTTGAVAANIKVANDSHGIAAAGGFVWVTSYSGNSVTQVNATTNQVVATILVDDGPRFIAGGDLGVWALCQGTGTVIHIDPATGSVVAKVDANNLGGGGDIAVGEGSVWVTTFGKPVTRINPVTHQVVVQYVGDGFGDAIRAGAGYVWVSGGKLSQIKPDPL